MPVEPTGTPLHLVQKARTCKTISSCREAVMLWCQGERRLDGDNDGVPCENICYNETVVARYRAEIGC